MEMDRSVISKLVKEKVTSICDISEWYLYPFNTDIDVTKEKFENGDISDRDLDVCRYDFTASIIHDVMIFVFDRLDQSIHSSNPNLEYLHDTIREEILSLIK